MEKYILFYVLALFAEIIGTVSGFGSSILFVPLASMFFDFKIVLGITALFHVFSNLSKIFLFKKGIDKNIVLKLGIPAIIFVILGAILSNVVPQKELELGMNLVLLILTIFLIININTELKQNDKLLVTGGIISGFLAGIIGSGGMIRGITLAAFNLKKEVFIATSAVIDLGVDSSRAIIYFLNGFIVKEFLFTLPGLLVVSIAGTYFGKIILNKVPQTVFKYIVLAVILVTALFQTGKYFLN